MDSKDNGSGVQYRFRAGKIEFDEAQFELRVDGQPVALERKPLEVLRELLLNAKELVSRQHLLDTVWEGRPTVPEVLGNAIVKLRKAVQDPQGDWIVTVPRKGYRCVADVERIAVGRRTVSPLALQAGCPVPGRDELELESQLGATAGSEVWLARHLASDERRVFKFSRDGECLAALKREVALYHVLRDGLGERDDLVRISGWNFASPPFYLECDYAGVDLATWAAAGDRLAALSLDERLALFLQIAVAVEAAHGIGALHKDLKPANVLIAPRANGGWQVRVADFGSARLLQPGVLEQLGISRLSATVTDAANDDSGGGTPFYMAPEVIDGASPTVRSDLYSLGLMLYQISIANLRRPLAPGWEEHVDDVLLREDIAAATAGDPERRLASVAELVQRLQNRESRAVRRQQIAAAEARALIAERALERSRARRPWVIAALASLVIGLGTSLWLYYGEAAARLEAQREAARSRAINEFMNGLLRAADPDSPGGGNKVTIEDALVLARARLKDEFNDDPITKGALYATLGEVYFGWSAYGKALPLQQQATELLAAALGKDDAATLTVQYQMARTLDMLTRHADAQRLLTATDRAAGQLLRKDSRLALLAHWTRGGSALLQLQPAAALIEFERAEAIRAKAVPGDDAWLIRVRASLAWCDVRMGRDAHALQVLDALMAPKYTPERLGVNDWAKIHLQYGLALMNLGRHAEAADITKDAIAELGRVLDPDHYMVGLGWNHLAAVFKANAQWEQSLDASLRAHRIFEATLGPDNRATLAARGDLAVLDYLRGRGGESLPALESVHVALTQAFGAASPLTQYVDFYLAGALLDGGRAEQAAALWEGLKPAALAAADPAKDWEPRLQGLRGRILLAGDQPEDGVALLRAAIDELEQRQSKPWVIRPLQQALTSDQERRSRRPPLAVSRDSQR